MNFNINSEENHSNTNKTFEFQGADSPNHEINGNSEVEAKETEQKEGQSENDTMKKSLVGFAWGVLASFLIAAGTVCVQVWSFPIYKSEICCRLLHNKLKKGFYINSTKIIYLCCSFCISLFITTRPQSCGKVMFSVMSVHHSVHRGILCDNYPWCIGPHHTGSPTIYGPGVPVQDPSPLYRAQALVSY